MSDILQKEHDGTRSKTSRMPSVIIVSIGTLCFLSVTLCVSAIILTLQRLKELDPLMRLIELDVIVLLAASAVSTLFLLLLTYRQYRSIVAQRMFLHNGKLSVDTMLRNAPGMGLLAELETACIKVLDEDCRIVTLGKTARKVLDIDSEEPFIGMLATDFVHPRDVEPYQDAIRRAADGEITEVEFELFCPDGSRRWLSQRSKRIDVPGRTKGPRLVFCLTHEITERKLANDRLDLAIDITRQGLWDEWIKTDKIFYNHNWFSMLGYEPGELAISQGTWHELVHPDDMKQAEDEFRRHIAGEVDTYRTEYRMRTKQGAWKWIQDVGRVVERTENGDPVRAIGVHIDIDQTKRLELALRSIISFNSIQHDDSVLLHICQTLTAFLDVDIACICKLDVQGDQMAEIIAGWSPNGKIPSERYPLAGSPCGVTHSDTYCHFSKDVASIFPEDSALADMNAQSYTGLLLNNSAGEHIGLLVIVHSSPREGSKHLESTMRLIGARAAAELERYQIECELHRTRERLFSIAERLETATTGAGLGIFEYRFDSDIMIWDETMHRLYGTSKQSDKPSRQLWESRIHPDDYVQNQILQPEYFAEHNSVETTFRVLPGGDRVRHISVVATVTRSADGKPISLTGVNWDISDLIEANNDLMRAKELAESASSAKGDFLANMSHEIRTPLTAIIGYTELLTSDTALTQDPEGLSSSLRAIHNNASHLLVILNDILDLSKVDAGMMHVESVTLDPAELIRETVLMLSGRARAKHIGLAVEFLTELPSAVESDPTRLRQILLNLIGNAIKFTDYGGVTVRVSYQSLPDRSGMVAISVTDTGIGISPKDIELLRNFDPFTQADGSMTRRFGGTGLGLRLSNVFAQKLGGCMTIESELGKGSTFTVSIGVRATIDGAMNWPSSIVAGAGEHSSEPTRQHRLPQEGLEGLHILLVEDGLDNQKLLSFILQKAGAHVALAQNGREAVEYIRGLSDIATASVDLVLMDMQMPEIDGYSATGMIRELGYFGPIVALTAHAMDGDRKRCIQAGCQDYLPKPVSSRVLVETCQKWTGWRWEKSIAA